MNPSKKVDFHAHYLPKTYVEYLKKWENAKPDGFPTPEWSPEKHLQLAEKLGIAFSFLSISSPNLSKADRETEIRLVHQINREGAEIISRYPTRLGLFASLPLPHADAALEEARFALEELRADGFELTTNYAGVYLGDPRYDSLMAYLNRKGTVVAVHPTSPSAVPEGCCDILPIPALEFFFDTTRTFTNMVIHNIFGRYPNIKWIFPHAGAFLSIFSDRVGGFAVHMRSSVDSDLPLDFKGDMRHVYFDAAGFTVQKQLGALLKDVGPENLVYGSDGPYTPNAACAALCGAMEDYEGMTDVEKRALFTDNAVRIVPRLAEILGNSGTGNTVTYSDTPLTGKEKRNRFLRGVVAKIYKKLF